MMGELKCLNMLVLAGEQAAPNLLPARHFRPKQIYILHTNFPKSLSMAENLGLCLKEMVVCLVPVDDYDVAKIRAQVLTLLHDLPSVMVNVTGGTKPMSLGALEAARLTGAQPFYVRSQGIKTEIDLYGFEDTGAPFVCGNLTLQGTIGLEDYLVSYFGKNWVLSGFGTGPGEGFERAIYDILLPGMDEVKSNWRHASNQVEVDFVIRCNNQIGIVEAKTRQKAGSAEGIKQLALAGGQRFFGTYVKRFLVIDRSWQKNEKNLRELCEALGIILVELPGYAKTGSINASEQGKLLETIHAALGKPLKGVADSNP